MPRIVFVQQDGTRRGIDAVAGASVMQTAISHNVKGIEAECGGCLSCATCHVYVEEAWFAKLPEPEADEAEMLEFVAAERRPTSRLSCQIIVREALDGLVVHMPAVQTAV